MPRFSMNVIIVVLCMSWLIVNSRPSITKSMHTKSLREGDHITYRAQYSTIFVKVGKIDAQSDSITIVIRIPYLDGLTTEDTLFNCQSLSPEIRKHREIQQLCHEMARHIQVNDRMRNLIAEQIQTVLDINRLERGQTQSEESLVQAAGKMYNLRVDHDIMRSLDPIVTPIELVQDRVRRDPNSLLQADKTVTTTLDSNTDRTVFYPTSSVSSPTQRPPTHAFLLKVLMERLGGKWANLTSQAPVPQALQVIGQKLESKGIDLSIQTPVRRYKRIAAFGAGAIVGYKEGKKAGQNDRQWFHQYDVFYRKILTEHQETLITLQATDHQLVVVLNDTQAVVERNAAGITNTTQYVDYLYYHMDQVLIQINNQTLNEAIRDQWRTMFLGYLSKTVMTVQTRNIQYLMYLSYCRQLIQAVEQSVTTRGISKFLLSNQAVDKLINDVEVYLDKNMPEYSVSDRVKTQNFFTNNKIVRKTTVTAVGYELHVDIPVTTHKETMTLYKVKTYEMPTSTKHDKKGYHTTKIHLESSYFAISENNSFYAITSDHNILTCERGPFDYWDCPFTHVTYSTKVPSCALGLYTDNWVMIRLECNPELIVRASALPLLVENIFEGTYLVIVYQRQIKDHWKMICPETGAYKYDACATVCLIHMMCRCSLVIPSLKEQDADLVTIGPSIQDCTGKAMVTHVQGKILRFQNRIYSAMREESNLLANESLDWNSPWLGKISPEKPLTLDRPVFSVTNQSTVKIKKFSFNEVRKEVKSKFDSNQYYGKDTPPMDDYGGSNSRLFYIISGVIIVVGLLMMSCCVYCCCGHWIAKRCCPVPGGGSTTQSNDQIEMQSRRRRIPPQEESEDETILTQPAGPSHRVPDCYLEENIHDKRTSNVSPESNRSALIPDYNTVYVRPVAPVSSAATTGQRRVKKRVRQCEDSAVMNSATSAPPNVTMTVEMDENKPPKATGRSSSGGRASGASNSKRHLSMATTVGSIAVLMPTQTTAFTVDHPLNQTSPLPDRTMFIFVLNLCALVIGLLIIVRHAYKLALNARRIRYKASTFLRRVFHINVKTSAKIYLEISNYRECAYLPLVELAIPPKDLYYVKPFVEEPRCTLHLALCRSYLKVRWRSSGIVVKSPQHADLYIRLPRSIIVPGASRYILMDILNGPYVVTLIMRHANTFCERLPVLGSGASDD